MADLSLAEGLGVLDRRTTLVRNALYVFMAFSVANILVSLGTTTGTIDLNVPSPIMGVAGLVLVLYALAMIACVILVGMWIYRAHANLRAGGIDGLEFSPGWAVGWYFIPFANLFKPFQAMRELWNAAHQQSDGYTEAADPKLTAWWGTWIVGNILSNAGSRIEGLGGRGAGIGGMLDIFATALLMAAAWLLLQIVLEVNAAQRSQIAIAATFA